MKTLERNLRPIWYCLYKETVRMVNADGRRTGEEIVVYDDPVRILANVSQATGQSNTEQFGNLANYDKVIVTSDTALPVDESTVFFLDKAPEFETRETYEITPSQTLLGGDTATKVEIDVPLYDHTVVRVAKSLNSISIAVKQVNVS